MTASLTLVAIMAVLYGAGVYVMLERSLTRVLIGFLLVGNATNILIFIMSGPSGSAPIVSDNTADKAQVDPLPQALILTAIVINFGITAFVLALIYRSWWLARLGTKGDTVPDEHAGETEETTDAAFESVEDDDQAIQEILDASDEHPDSAGSVDPRTGRTSLPDRASSGCAAPSDRLSSPERPSSPDRPSSSDRPERRDR